MERNMTTTATNIHTEKVIASNFANGKEILYNTIEEYRSIPKCDREEYVMRMQGFLLAAKQQSEMLREETARANRAKQAAENKYNETIEELAVIKRKWWFKLFNYANTKIYRR